MIKFKVLKMKEFKKLQTEMSKLKKLQENDYDDVVKAAQLAGGYVIEWDFTDIETGEALPLPTIQPGVIEELTRVQLQELFTEFGAAQEPVPNSKSDNS